jgi:hypothetical protein
MNEYLWYKLHERRKLIFVRGKNAVQHEKENAYSSLDSVQKVINTTV